MKLEKLCESIYNGTLSEAIQPMNTERYGNFNDEKYRAKDNLEINTGERSFQDMRQIAISTLQELLNDYKNNPKMVLRGLSTFRNSVDKFVSDNRDYYDFPSEENLDMETAEDVCAMILTYYIIETKEDLKAIFYNYPHYGNLLYEMCLRIMRNNKKLAAILEKAYNF